MSQPAPLPAAATAAEFLVPATIHLGGGALRELPGHVVRLGASRVLVVSDAGVRRLGVLARVEDDLRAAGLQVTTYEGVQPDPTTTNVAEGVVALRAGGCQAIVAVGGGSPMDAAKVIAVASVDDRPLTELAGADRITRPGPPVIAVPTTAGTGAEATRVAVITDPERDVKMLLISRHLLPAAAVVDYELTLSMPPALTAAVGVDTLTHGIEAYVSRRAGPMTDPLALSCVRLVAGHLERAWRDGGDREARSAMMTAACQGGMAFANSSVALVHGMARPLGALFHLPHGLANAVLLPTVTRWSIPAAARRYAEVARAAGVAGAGDPDDAACARLVDWLAALNERLRLPRLSAAIGAERHARFAAEEARMAADALASGSPGNNPRQATAAEIVDLYRQAW